MKLAHETIITYKLRLGVNLLVLFTVNFLLKIKLK